MCNQSVAGMNVQTKQSQKYSRINQTLAIPGNRFARDDLHMVRKGKKIKGPQGVAKHKNPKQ